jgi:hypothetical protein
MEEIMANAEDHAEDLSSLSELWGGTKRPREKQKTPRAP